MTSWQGGACYEEVRELWQHVKDAEQTASEAIAELHTHKDSAAHATFELKVSATWELTHVSAKSCCMHLVRLSDLVHALAAHVIPLVSWLKMILCF